MNEKEAKFFIELNLLITKNQSIFTDHEIVDMTFGGICIFMATIDDGDNLKDFMMIKMNAVFHDIRERMYKND